MTSSGPVRIFLWPFIDSIVLVQIMVSERDRESEIKQHSGLTTWRQVLGTCYRNTQLALNMWLIFLFYFFQRIGLVPKAGIAHLYTPARQAALIDLQAFFAVPLKKIEEEWARQVLITWFVTAVRRCWLKCLWMVSMPLADIPTSPATFIVANVIWKRHINNSASI